jgi:uncharacterized protein DUF6398
MSPAKRSLTVPDSMRPAYDAIVELTDAFCAAHLDAECSTLCSELAAALARKRPSPIDRGRPAVWAAGVISALALVNFWYDRTQTPHTSHARLCEFFSAASSTVTAKSKQIRILFRMYQFDPDWTAPSKVDSNPMIWFLSVNGLIVDIRHMPREAQEVAFEKGLIPYIPADRQPDSDE